MGRRDRNTRRKRGPAAAPRGSQNQVVDQGLLASRFWPLAIAGLIALLVAYLAHAWHFRHYVNDDAFITFRYSRFLAMGRGPFFNVGERVEGYSNPLLMLLMVPVIAWGGEHAALPAAKAIGVVCGASSLVAAFVLCLILQREEPKRPVVWAGACLAAGLIAVSPSYAINSMSGLETTLFALSVTAGVLLGTLSIQQGRWRGAGLAFAGAVLSRPEGVVIFAVFWSAQAISALATRTLGQVRRQLAMDAAIVTAAFAAQLIVRRVIYGEWLPMTYFAKSGGFWAFDAGAYVRDGIAVPLGGILAIAIGAIGCLLDRGARRSIAPAAAVALTGALLPFVTGTDWMPGQRMLMPYLPLAAALMAVGWCRVAGRPIAKPIWLAPALAVLIVPLIWAGQRESEQELVNDSSIRATGYREGHTALAEWFRSGAAKPGDTIALMDTGIIGFFCIDQQILDITGLTNRFIAKSPGGFLDKDYDPAYVLDQKPRFIVLVLKALGNDGGPPAGAGFSTWTNIERNILHHPDFNRWYRKPREIGAAGEPWQDRTAKGLGAVRMFHHAHPGVFYLLTVFERQPRPDTWSS